MDEKAWCGLTRQIASNDFVRVDDELEGLDDHVADEEGADGLAAGVSRHPVDHSETDEGRPDVAREDFRGRGGNDAKPSEHRLRRYKQREPEEERGGTADHERKTRTHGGRLIEHGRGWDRHRQLGRGPADGAS